MAAGCEAGQWDVIDHTWTFHHYDCMIEVWKVHGPPPFISLAVMNGHSPKQGTKENSGSTDEKEYGTMADLAAMFGLGDSKKKAML